MIADNPNLLLNVICFFFPYIGLIVYLVTKDATPKKARSLGKASVAGGIMYLVGFVLLNVVVWRVLSPIHDDMSRTVDEMMEDETKEKSKPQPQKKSKQKDVKR